MPNPVGPNQSSPIPTASYDNEAGVCLPPSAEAPRNSSGKTNATSSGEPQPSPAAVAQLVKSAPKSCVGPVLEAGLTCAGAALTILAGSTTGAGAVAAAAIGGAYCGVKVMSAEECLRQEQ